MSTVHTSARALAVTGGCVVERVLTVPELQPGTNPAAVLDFVTAIKFDNDSSSASKPNIYPAKDYAQRGAQMNNMTTQSEHTFIK